MSPPEGTVVIAYCIRLASPVRPGVLHGDAGQNLSDEGRYHEQEAVDDSALA